MGKKLDVTIVEEKINITSFKDIIYNFCYQSLEDRPLIRGIEFDKSVISFKRNSYNYFLTLFLLFLLHTECYLRTGNTHSSTNLISKTIHVSRPRSYRYKKSNIKF